MFIIISQSIKISTNETIMLCSLLYLVFISIYLYNIILFKIHNEFDEVDYQFYHGINSSFTVRVFLCLSSRSYYYVCPIRLKSKTFQLISEYLTIILTKFTEYIIIFHEI